MRHKLTKLITLISYTINKSNIRQGVHYLKEYGVRAVVKKIKDTLRDIIVQLFYQLWIDKYQLWIVKNEPKERDLEKQRYIKFNWEPRISIIVPTFNTPRQFLVDMIESILKQTYFNWELCIADGASKKFYVREVIEGYAKRDARIRFKFLEKNKGIAGNSNEAISLATGEFIAVLDHDDMLPPFALFEIVKAINENPDVDFIYSDEDKITEGGEKRLYPHFKPDWSPDTFRSYNYISHLSVFKKELLEKVGSFRAGYDGSQDYDLMLRAIEQAKRIFHIPKVLYHCRISRNSVEGYVDAKPFAYESAKRAIRDHLSRVSLKGTVEDGLFVHSFKIAYEIDGDPKVSIIISNKDHIEDLKGCIDSILSKTSYKNYEVLIVENNSSEQEIFKYYSAISRLDKIKVIKWDNPFNFSAINNFAVKYATGKFLLFMNNDMEVINHDWMERLLEHAIRKEVGTVGAKLYYPDGTIQHAGVILGLGGVAGHSHKHFPGNNAGYMGRTQVIQNLSAVTAACMMTRKDVFEEVGGLDEGYSHAFNDVDLCMKIREKGYLIVWTPYADLYHHESKSRGYEDTSKKQKRFKKEINRFQEKWGDFLKKGDPYYSPNLTLDKEDFSIRI